MFHSFQTNCRNEMNRSSASTGSNPDTEQSGGNRNMEQEGESSRGNAVASQLALDAAVAQALQELEFADTSFGEHTGFESDKDDSSSGMISDYVSLKHLLV